MTTYNGAAVADSTIAFQKGITLQQGRALRDNPLAIAEGSPGAPRVQGGAIASDNNGFTQVAVTASDDVVIQAGLGVVAGTTTTSSTTFVTARSFLNNAYTGSIRFKAFQSAGGGFTSTLRLMKNGVQVVSYTTTSSAARVTDVSVAIGDVLSWEHQISSASNSSTLTALTESATDGYVERPVYWLASQA